MAQQNIMVLGATSQTGQALRYLSSQKTVPADWNLNLFSRAELNITDPAALRAAIQEVKPSLIINASGITHVDEAERDQEPATATNFYAVAQLAAQCSVMDIPLIHLSTDYVFDGTKGQPYLPDDLMNPINHYGDSKMMGEEAIRHELAWHVILRTSSVFSAFRRNILTKALAMIDESNELRIVTDLMSTPTYALDIAEAVIEIGQQILNGKCDGYGTFHLTGAPVASRFDFVEAVMQIYASYADKLPHLTPTVCAEFTEYVRRPPYSALNCQKIKDIYGIEQKSWKAGIAHALTMLDNEQKLRHLRPLLIKEE